jgi:heat-inducible transcriptional repressor
MVRNVDHESRKKAILAATINKYIENGTAVASEDIAEGFGVSSATVRNVFADLEESGYLTHPYTSGGRIPTNKGYRYYVDFLIAQIQLVGEDKDRIDNEYKSEMKRLEDVLEKTSELISGVTHYAGITSFLDWQDKFFYNGLSQVFDHPEFQDLGKIRLFIKIIEEKQRLLEIINRDFEDKVKVYIGEELGCPEICGCSLIVSRYRLKNKPMGRIAVLGPMRMQYQHTIPALEYISDILTEALDTI